DLERPAVKHRYDPQRDLVVYEDFAGSLLRLESGQAAIFYPSDVHMPGLHGSSTQQVIRKTVIKVPVDGS
ncbi:MAG: YhcH/YjgK/YiaL family protein, partial [Opitutus sp.]